MKKKTVTVYTKPGCQPCIATKRWLDKRGIEYTAIDITQSPMDLAAVKALGYEGVPVIVVSSGDPETDLHWKDFHPDNMAKYILPQPAAV